MNFFSDIELPTLVRDALADIGFSEPTPIQKEAIPPALEGRDILGIAQTGTGKTGAFGIPLVAKIIKDTRSQALVLAPTRELAIQVLEELTKFMGSTKVPTALLIGGSPMPVQEKELKASPRLIVATPGRLRDHIERGNAMLHKMNYLVLDEADRMLDMGFEKDLDQIVKFLTGKRQTLLFSATMPKNIVSLVGRYLTDPIKVKVDGALKAKENINQECIRVQSGKKFSVLCQELDERKGSVIIFVKRKREVDELSEDLSHEGFDVNAIHGDLNQFQRNSILEDYRNQKFRILVATDVASRGLDVPHIEHVINYDVPQSADDYVHRIGRTARAGKKGEALTLLSKHDEKLWVAIEKLMGLDKKNSAPKEASKLASEPQTPQHHSGALVPKKHRKK